MIKIKRTKIIFFHFIYDNVFFEGNYHNGLMTLERNNLSYASSIILSIPFFNFYILKFQAFEIFESIHEFYFLITVKTVYASYLPFIFTSTTINLSLTNDRMKIATLYFNFNHLFICLVILFNILIF